MSWAAISLQHPAPDHGKTSTVNRASSALALTAALLLAACNSPSPDTARPVASAEAPGLLVPEMSADATWWLNGPPSSLTAARGSVVLIDAWDRLCAPCIASVPAVLALKSRYGARGLRVVSVTAFDDAPGEREIVAASAREAHMTYPCFLDKGSVWQHAVGTSGMIPMFLIVDRNGRLAFSGKGLLLQGTPAFDSLAAAIERALAGS
jgi:thiol-disulfide isomerase/thioredoxin